MQDAEGQGLSARAARLARQLRDELSTRQPGDRIETEADLSRRYGVSRTMVREAISALRNEGLVETRQGSGTFVTAPLLEAPLRLLNPLVDLRAFRDLYELRAPTEAAAAALAARRRSAADLVTLSGAVDGMADDASRLRCDHLFHVTVANATGNRLFQRFVGHIDGRLFAFLERAVENTRARLADRVGTVIAEHAAILRAIEQGQADKAELAMKRHLAASAKRMALLLGDDG